MARAVPASGQGHGSPLRHVGRPAVALARVLGTPVDQPATHQLVAEAQHLDGRSERPRSGAGCGGAGLVQVGGRGAQTFSRSAPIVVSGPCPVCTTVSSGRSSSCRRMEPMIRSASCRTGRWPRAAVEQGVAGEARSRGRGRRGRPHPARGPACGSRSPRHRRWSGSCPSERSTSQSSAPSSSPPWVSSHRGRSSGCSRIGAPVATRRAGATRTWSSCACVHTMAFTARPPTRPRMASTSCGASIDQALLVVADHPDVVVDVEGLAVEGEGARDDGVVDARPSEHHHGAKDVARVHLSKAASTSPSPISSLTKASRSSRPCW